MTTYILIGVVAAARLAVAAMLARHIADGTMFLWHFNASRRTT
jgi:hypothetical protein